MNKNVRIPVSVVLAVIAFTFLTIATIASLVFYGKDPSIVITFVLALLPATIGVVIVSGQIDSANTNTLDQNKTLEAIHGQVNGKLAAQFAAIHARLDTLDVPYPLPKGHENPAVVIDNVPKGAPIDVPNSLVTIIPDNLEVSPTDSAPNQ